MKISLKTGDLEIMWRWIYFPKWFQYLLRHWKSSTYKQKPTLVKSPYVKPWIAPTPIIKGMSFKRFVSLMSKKISLSFSTKLSFCLFSFSYPSKPFFTSVSLSLFSSSSFRFDERKNIVKIIPHVAVPTKIENRTCLVCNSESSSEFCCWCMFDWVFVIDGQ